MKKIILIGSTGSGKSTLSQALNKQEISYKKTQTMEYCNNVLDTPGEYIENPRWYNALITASYDCDIIGLVFDCTNEKSLFPPSFASIFNKPTIGIITKVDIKDCDTNWHREILYQAGVEEVYEVSVYKDIGIREIHNYLI